MRRFVFALALGAWLAASAAPALAAGDQSAPLKRKERFVLHLVDEQEGEDEGPSPLETIRFALLDDAMQPAGTLDVMVTFTVRGATDDDPSIGILNAVASLAEGRIVAEGVAEFGSDMETFTLAILGGTGRYRTARGQVRVVPKDPGGRAAFRVLP